MKIKTCANLELVLRTIIYLVTVPLYLALLLVCWINYPLAWAWKKVKYLDWKVGNWLLRQSDPVKTRQFKIQSIIRNYTASDFWKVYGNNSKHNKHNGYGKR